ncbi:MAG TPA: DUF2164 family protein [Anaerovoracaceae bacterium]|nr:DUF2164 family protein [Anaerovoracaceae bacterium]
MDKNIKLSEQRKAYMISLIQSYFSKERGEKLGELAAGLLLDFFTSHLASEFYNQGVEDAHTYMAEKLEDMLGLQKYVSHT